MTAGMQKVKEGRLPAPLRCDLNLNYRSNLRTASSSCNNATMSFRIRITISTPLIRFSLWRKEYVRLAYLSAACHQPFSHAVAPLAWGQAWRNEVVCVGVSQCALPGLRH